MMNVIEKVEMSRKKS